VKAENKRDRDSSGRLQTTHAVSITVPVARGGMIQDRAIVTGLVYGILGTTLTLGLVLVAHIMFGANRIVSYLHELMFERGTLQYATLFLFWLTAGLLATRHFRLKWEASRFSDPMIQDFAARVRRESAVGDRMIRGLLDSFSRGCQGLGNSLPLLHNRILQGLRQARISESQAEVANVLESVEETDYLEMESSYNMIRFMIWVIPILGFLGTLIGMSNSIGSFQGVFDALATSDATMTIEETIGANLRGVTRGLALAFDTTLLALAVSALLNFCMTGLVRREEGLLVRVHNFVLENIINRFTTVKEQMPGFDSYADQALETRHREVLSALGKLSEAMSADIRGLEACFDNLQAQQRLSIQELATTLTRLLHEEEGKAEQEGRIPASASGVQAGGEINAAGLARLNDNIRAMAAALEKNSVRAEVMERIQHHLERNGERLDATTEAINRLADVSSRLEEVLSSMSGKRLQNGADTGQEAVTL